RIQLLERVRELRIAHQEQRDAGRDRGAGIGSGVPLLVLLAEIRDDQVGAAQEHARAQRVGARAHEVTVARARLLAQDVLAHGVRPIVVLLRPDELDGQTPRIQLAPQLLPPRAVDLSRQVDREWCHRPLLEGADSVCGENITDRRPPATRTRGYGVALSPRCRSRNCAMRRPWMMRLGSLRTPCPSSGKRRYSTTPPRSRI